MLRGRSADEELALRLAGRLHADPLGALDPPVAVAWEGDDVAFVRHDRELLLVDAPAPVREDELEAVADRVPARRWARLTHERRIALHRGQGRLAPLPLLRTDAAELQAARREHPLEHVGVLLPKLSHGLVIVLGRDSRLPQAGELGAGNGHSVRGRK